MDKSYLLLSTLLFSGSVMASELVYSPVNPSFGGNPLNGGYLMSNAQAQNKIKSPESSSFRQRSELERFNDSLRFRLLNQLLGDIGTNGQTSGSLVTDDFSVQIEQGNNGGLNITTTDKNTGATTTITVDGLIADQ